MARSTGSDVRRGLRTLTYVAVGAAVLWFAVQGGEYGTVDLVRQYREQKRLQREIDSLAGLVDSLGRFKNSVIADPRVQERIAREKFGMVRGNEVLYRFADPPPPDSGR